MDDANETVNVEVVAARTSADGDGSFDGYANGNAAVTIPQGCEVTIEFSNEDPAGARSLGIDEEPDRWTAGGTRRSGVR